MKVKSRAVSFVATVIAAVMSIVLIMQIPMLGNDVLALGEMQNVKISEDGILSWDEYPGALVYNINIGSGGGYCEGTSLDLKVWLKDFGMGNGTYTVEIYAMSDTRNNDGYQLTTAWKGEYTYTASDPQLDKATNLTWNGTVASWDPVPNAESYRVWLGGDYLGNLFFTGIETTSFDAYNYISEGTYEYWFKIQANAPGYISSEYVTGPKTTLSKTLESMKNVKISADGILSWDAFPGAKVYDFTVGSGGGYCEETSVDLGQSLKSYGSPSGTYDVEIFAMSDKFYNGGYAISSVWTGQYTYDATTPQLDKPTNLAWDGTSATWDAVPNAEYYNVVVRQGSNFKVYENVTSTSVDIKNFISEGENEYYFMVTAHASSYLGSNEARSPYKTFKNVVTYTVTFNVNGHGTAPDSQIVEAGDTCYKPDKPSAPGYSFGGWYEDSACTKKYDFDTPVTGNKTLYGKWTAVEMENVQISSDGILSWDKFPGATQYIINLDDNEIVCLKTKTSLDLKEILENVHKDAGTYDVSIYAAEYMDQLTVKWTGKYAYNTKAEEKELSFEDFVERLYVVALGRASEPEGKAFWSEHVGNGDLTGAQCANEFLLSQEFKGRGLTDEQFLTVLYSVFFDRPAADDPDGFNFWMNSLKTQGRDTVVDGFINSAEWCNVCATYGVRSGATRAKATIASENATKFATRLYTECLGRDAEEEGLKFWSLGLTNQELSGTQAAKEFFYCAEFVNANYNDEEYITRMYKTFMGREPDAEGKAYWLNNMKNGTTRDEVFNFFSTCPEFTEICKTYAIQR